MKFWITSRVAPNRSWSMTVSPGRALEPMSVPSSNVRNEALIEYRRGWERRAPPGVKRVGPGYKGEIVAAAIPRGGGGDRRGVVRGRGPLPPPRSPRQPATRAEQSDKAP